MTPLVIKRDATEEEFDQDKIARVVTAAGLKPSEGFQLATKMATWVQSLNKPKITTYEVREKVIEELKKINPIVADLFTQYEKTKDSGLNSGKIDDI